MITAVRINYVIGDATDPTWGPAGNKVIVHCCNDIGGWGSGFVIPLAKRWPVAEQVYRRAFNGPNPPQLGQIVTASYPKLPDGTDLWIANLVGQHSVAGATDDGEVPIRYDAINVGFRRLARVITDHMPATIHMPRMGCGLAGGDWRVIEALIKLNFIDNGIDVYVYDLPGQPFEGKQ